MKALIDHAEQSLFVLAKELTRVPLDARTKSLHLRALRLKRTIADWKEHAPSRDATLSALQEIEALAREAQQHRLHRSVSTCGERGCASPRQAAS